ncbi:hypothetical protein RISK_000583 [Rhodopirellula islandica]|uniref:Uncharacterized protein n=1 Tax=Rhodopirellula islandica TaxID=595434 RepID=A0A0J1BLZ9_RHOIS|nr:hypothetical protein RISK_000583 [Rhodopirellula islandica]
MTNRGQNHFHRNAVSKPHTVETHCRCYAATHEPSPSLL